MTTVVIPCYKAKKTLSQLLHNLSTQTREIKVILANDEPDSNYEDVIKQFPELKIKEVSTKENTGPGLARQRGLDAVDTEWVTFIDADDMLATPYSIEQLENGIMNNFTVMVQGAFLQPMRNIPNPQNPNETIKLTFQPRNDVTHPWVFGRLYNVKWLRDNKIEFSSLRAMEDGEFNAKLRMLIEGTNFNINIISDSVYCWTEGSEHSITRTVWKGHNNNIPIYNYGSCSVGAAYCFKQALEFVSKRSPFNPSIPRTATELMVDKYWSYFETKQNYPEYAEQADYIAIWWYKNCFKVYASTVTFESLETLFMRTLQPQRLGMFKQFPSETFKQWFERISNSDLPDFNELRSRIPQELRDLECNTGCSL